MKKIIFKKITFVSLKDIEFNKMIRKNKLFVFPAGPALASIDKNIKYYESLKKADYVFFDSGFFVLLLFFIKRTKVNKFSGFKFLKLFFSYLKKNTHQSLLCIDPSYKFSKSNKRYLNHLGINKVYNYLAPKYNTNNLRDKKLLKKINKLRPNFIMTNIGGGTQEILGLYLKKNLKFKTTIICTGGAISFLTGDQAPVNSLIDKLYLGWLVRLIFNPFIFLKRYLYGLKLVPMVLMNNVKVK